MKIETDIQTEDWEKIIRALVKEGWKIRSKYRGIDEGVDYDRPALQKGRLHLPPLCQVLLQHNSGSNFIYQGFITSLHFFKAHLQHGVFCHF